MLQGVKHQYKTVNEKVYFSQCVVEALKVCTLCVFLICVPDISIQNIPPPKKVTVCVNKYGGFSDFFLLIYS